MAENRTVKVTLKAEIASYVSQMMRGQQATESLGASAAVAGSDIEKALAQTEKAAQSSSQAFDQWGKVTKRTLAGMALLLGGFGAAMLHQGVQANSFREQNEIALATMLGTAEQAKAALDEVYSLATDTPFQFPVLTDQYKTLVSSRMELSTILPLMRAYSSAVAAVGGSSAELQQVADVFVDISNYGKLGTREVNRLAQAQIPIWQILADEAGTSVAEIRKLVEQGAYDSERAIQIITDGMQAQFGDMLENMGDSYAKWEDRVKGAQRRTAEQMAVPVQEVGKEVMRSLTDLFNETTAVLKTADWAPVIDPLMAIPETIDKLTKRISSGGAQDIIEAVGEGLELVAAAGEMVVNVALPLVDVIGIATRAGMPLVDVVTALLDGFNSLPAPVQAGIAALALIRTLNGPYTSMIRTVTGFTTTTRAAMAAQIAANQATLIGVNTVNGATVAQGRFAAAQVAVRSALAQTTTAARGAGAAMMGAFGGPVGLAVAGALTAVTVATSAWTDAQQKAEEAARAQESAIDAVTASLDRNTGAVTENTKETIANLLIDAGLPRFLNEMGVGLDEFQEALYGGADAQEAFRQKLIKAAQTPDMLALLERTKLGAGDAAAGIEEVARQMDVLDGTAFGLKKSGLETLTPDAYAAVGALQIFDAQLNVNTGSVVRFRQQAELAGRELDINGQVTVDTSQAMSALQSVQDAATKALSSFISLAPQKRKTSGGGGGGGRSGDSPQVKALKAEQKEIKKRTDAEKKAASEYEKVMRKRAQEAEKSAREAEKAAQDAASAEESALDRSSRAVDAYVSAQRQRAAIERTLAAENDPVRRAQLQQALTDALAHESAMLTAKTLAEREAAAATAENQVAQERATTSVNDASSAQAALEAAADRSAKVQEQASAQVEAAAERLAKATEASSSRAGGAMSGAADQAKESLREWMDRLKEQIRAQTEWADNMVWLAGNASSAVVSKFSEMGADGAYLLAELRKNGGKELGELESMFGDTAAQTKLDLVQSATVLNDIYPALVQKFGRKAADELRSSVFKGKTDVDQMLSTLKADYDGKNWRIGIDANTTAAIRAAGGLVDYIQRQKPTIKVLLEGSALKIGTKYVTPFASGGPVEGRGPKGKDSVPAVLAPGEHVLTAEDVDAMGGQGAVSDFRKSLHQSPPDISRATSAGGGGGGPRTVINQTVYYPVAEPSSKAAIAASRREAG